MVEVLENKREGAENKTKTEICEREKNPHLPEVSKIGKTTIKRIRKPSK